MKRKKQYFVLVFTGRIFGTYIGPYSTQENANYMAFIFCEKLKNRGGK